MLAMQRVLARPARLSSVVLAALLASMLAASALAAQTDPADGVLAGRVVDHDGRAAVGVKATFFQALPDGSRGRFWGEVLTDGAGDYRFPVVAGCHVLTLVAPDGRSFGGSDWWQRPRCVDPGQTATFDDAVLDAPIEASIGGRVSVAGGDAGPGVTVDLFDAAADGSRGRFLGDRSTGPDGRFRFEVGAGCYVATFIAPDGASFDGQRWYQPAVCVAEGEDRIDLDAVLDGDGPDPLLRCQLPAGGTTRLADFVALRQSGAPVDQLNQGRIDGVRTFVRAVFALDPDRMQWGERGVELAFDIGIDGPLDNRYRAELRETVIDQPIPVGTTQAYCMRFEVTELPDLYGPVTIFQRFNRDNDGPDIGIELTGANQFSDAVPNELQVVAFDGRHRIRGVELEAVNTLLVAVHNDGGQGAYRVVLNGRILRDVSGLDTVGSPDGGWAQFGLYPHGLYDNDGPNRQDQIDSGRTRVEIEYLDFALTDYVDGPVSLDDFTVG